MKLSISGSSLHNPLASFLLSYSILAEEIKQHRHFTNSACSSAKNKIMLVKIMTFNS
jgi:hypothetical protein